MAAHQEKAEEWLKKAEKKCKSFQLFGNSKFEDAADYFQKAANSYKMAKMWDDAGASFVRAAECHEKLKSKHEMATSYLDAGTCYKKSNFVSAIEVLKLAIEVFTDEGRFNQAAKHTKEIAELYEGEMDYENAVTYFQSAADYYSGEDATSSANQCLLKVARYSAASGDFSRAIDIYESVGRSALDNNLLKWGAKDHFLRAGVCRAAAGDPDELSRALERYKDQDPSFADSREARLLDEICEALGSQDVDAFTNAVFEFDSVQKIDAALTSLLLAIKNNLKEGPDIL